MSTYHAYNVSSKTQFADLSSADLKKKFTEDSNLDIWLVWRPGFSDWKKASDLEEIQKLLREPAPTPPPLPVAPPLPLEVMATDKSSSSEELEFRIVDVSDEKPVSSTPASPTIDLRKYPRILGRLRTIITNRDRAFITYTRDISLGGAFLEHPIPEDLLKGTVDIFITGPTSKESIVFRCQPVKDQSEFYRFSFIESEEHNQRKLTEWFRHLGQGNSKKI